MYGVPSSDVRNHMNTLYSSNAIGAFHCNPEYILDIRFCLVSMHIVIPNLILTIHLARADHQNGIREFIHAISGRIRRHTSSVTRPRQY